jgi:hypothetical protein
MRVTFPRRASQVDPMAVPSDENSRVAKTLLTQCGGTIQYPKVAQATT